ncbi:hydrogenase (NiFe) small subunit HydA, partial [Helicobacter pylori]
EVANRLPVIWLHMAECTGCSESLLRSADPTIDSIIFDYINLEYHETIMVASGFQAEKSLHDAIEKHKNNYILMVEGGIPQGTEYFLTQG